MSSYETHLSQGEICNSVFKSAHFKHPQIQSHQTSKDMILSIVGRDEANHPVFLGSGQQDWFIWLNHARYLERPGIFVDLATNHPILRSNTLIWEECLGWHGVCIEPLPKLHKLIRRDRTCKLVPTCISTTTDTVKFWQAKENEGGASRISNTSTTWMGRPKPGSFVDIECIPLSTALRSAGLTRVDVMSLDIEGHEASALKSLDLHQISVDIIIAEEGERLVTEYPGLLETHDNRGTIYGLGDDTVFTRKGFKFAIEERGGSVIPNKYNDKRPRPLKVQCWQCCTIPDNKASGQGTRNY